MVFTAMSYGNAEDRESARLAVKAVLDEQPAPDLQAELDATNRQVEILSDALAESRREPAPVQEPVGNWVWSWLMDWCKRNGIAPATRNSLFAMVKDARSKFDTTPPPAQPAPVQGPSGDYLSDFQEGQWWLAELDAAVVNGTPAQRSAVAVVRNLLATVVANTTPAAQPAPVGEVKDLFTQTAWEKLDVRGSTKVYLATPPAQEFMCSTGLCHYKAQRQWVGLTHDEYDAICDKHSAISDFDFLSDIEAKLKELNT
jgi:hypothetical protein